MSDVCELQEELERLEAQIARVRVRLAVVSGIGFGTDGIRDPHAPCAAFESGDPKSHYGDCETDGHYLCNECRRRASYEDCGERPSYCTCLLGVSP